MKFRACPDSPFLWPYLRCFSHMGMVVQAVSSKPANNAEISKGFRARLNQRAVPSTEIRSSESFTASHMRETVRVFFFNMI